MESGMGGRQTGCRRTAAAARGTSGAKAGAPKKADYSLRPGEQRDFTLQRAYKAHERQKRLSEPFLFSLPPTARNRENGCSRFCLPPGNPLRQAVLCQPGIRFQKIRSFARTSSPGGPGWKIPYRKLMRIQGQEEGAGNGDIPLFLSIAKRAAFPIRESGSAVF